MQQLRAPCRSMDVIILCVMLQELDLRLNPVTKNEPDYRLFVVHMLVNLRRLGKHV